MKKIFLYTAIIISGLSIPLFAYGILNTMASIKYETENPDDCISTVSGHDLCMTIDVLKGLIVISVITFILLLVYKNRFSENSKV